MDTQTQIERLIELAIIQRSELKRLVDELPQLREHLSSEIEKTFEDAEPQLRAELEEFIEKRATDATAKTGAALEAKIKELSSNLEISTQARFNAIIAEREENARLAAEAEAKIAEHAASLPSAVKDIVSAELARFPRAGEIDQLRKEFAEPRGLNPRGKWQAGETYNKLDLVTINGDSYTSNTDGNRTRPSRSSADWTLVAARGTGGGGGPTSLSELTTVPSDGDVLIGSGTSWVTSNLTAGAGISITVGPGAITISATDGDITLDDGTAASPSLHFTNDPDTGLYRPAANTLGISVSGTQVAYFDENGLTVPSAGVVAGGSFHGANGNANNPSFSFTSDQDTGFYRHGTNELGISIGGTQKAVMTSTTFTVTPNLVSSGTTTMTGAASGSTLSLSGNATVADTILGSSGPSVKSTLSARAPRQGLVFDGTRGAEISGPTLGAGDWTFSGWVYCKALGGSILGGANNSLRVSLRTNGAVFYGLQGGANSADTSTALPVDKWSHLVITKSGTSGTVYLNGISIQTSTDGRNYSAAQGFIGSTSNATGDLFNGVIVPSIYNRALSASEVVALYEAGAPAGADYQYTGTSNWLPDSIGGGALSFGSANTTSFSINNTSGSTVYLNLYKSGTASRVGQKFRVATTITTLTGGTVSLGWANNSITPVTIEGTESNDVTLIATPSSTSGPFIAIPSGVNVVATYTITPLGLLLAPDAAQAGGGLVWYDTSGNAANISWTSGVSWNVPFGNNIAASGTNQNITLTPSGTGSVLAHDTNAFYRNTNSGSDTATKLKVKTASNAFLAIDGAAATAAVNFGIYNSSSNPVRQSAIVGIASNTTAGSEAGYLSFFTQTGGSSLTERGRFTENGNLFIGKTTPDTGQKLQVSGRISAVDSTGSAIIFANQAGGSFTSNSAAFEASADNPNTGANNRAFGTYRTGDTAYRLLVTMDGSLAWGPGNANNDWLLERVNSTNIRLGVTSGANIFGIASGGSRKGYLYWDTTNFQVGTDSGNLILDSAGGDVVVASTRALKLGNQYQAGAPTATGYVTIKDSAGNTYKVLVGT